MALRSESDPTLTLLAASSDTKISKVRQLFLLAVTATFLSVAAKAEALGLSPTCARQ